MTLGERIKKRRLELQLRREEVAVATGVTYAQIARYELDENLPTSEIVVKLAKALQVTADWLLGNNEDLGFADLTEVEKDALALLRTHSPQKQAELVEVLRAITNLYSPISSLKGKH